jgi:pyruvate ferredoxin oxidoreductase gamma subunit
VSDGTIIVNTANPESSALKRLKLQPGQQLWTVDASQIAIELIKRNVPNTPILGVFARSVPVLDIDTMSKALDELMSETFSPNIVEANLKALRCGHDQAKRIEVEVATNV